MVPIDFRWILIALCSIFAALPEKAAIAGTDQSVASYPGDSLDWFVCAPDNTTFAVAIHGSEGVSVYKGHSKIGSFEAVFNPTFSPNSASFAFLAVDRGSAFIEANGHRMPDLNSAKGAMANPQLIAMRMAAAVAYDFDGSNLAYIDTAPEQPQQPNIPGAFTATPLAMYVNGIAQPSHAEVGVPVFNPVRNELIYRVRDSADPPAPRPMKLSYVNRAGVPGVKYYSVADPVFSINGSRLAYSARVDSGNFVVVSDDKETPEYPFINNIIFSPNGKRLAFISGVFGAGQAAIVDGTANATFPWVDPVVFSSDSAKYGYVANTNIAWGATGPNETIIIVNGNSVARHTDARAFGPFFGGQSRIAYILVSGARSYMKIDDRQEGPYARVGLPVFSGDGKRVAYSALDGISNQFKVIVDGVPSSESYLAIAGLHFSAENIVDYLGVQAVNGQLSILHESKGP